MDTEKDISWKKVKFVFSRSLKAMWNFHWIYKEIIPSTVSRSVVDAKFFVIFHASGSILLNNGIIKCFVHFFGNFLQKMGGIHFNSHIKNGHFNNVFRSPPFSPFLGVAFKDLYEKSRYSTTTNHFKNKLIKARE